MNESAIEIIIRSSSQFSVDFLTVYANICYFLIIITEGCNTVSQLQAQSLTVEVCWVVGQLFDDGEFAMSKLKCRPVMSKIEHHPH